MKSITCVGWSFHGATEGGEPEIHSLWPVESGLVRFAAPGMAQHMIRTSKSFD
jgi:hypothetical protein